MSRILILLLLFISLSFSEDFQQYTKQHLHILKIKKGEFVKLPETSVYITVLSTDTNSGRAEVKILSEKGSVSEDEYTGEDFSLFLGKVIKNVYLLKRDCKTDSIVEKREIKSVDNITCMKNKDICKKKSVYTDEICETQVFPVYEFGRYFTKGWGFTVSSVGKDYIIISYSLKRKEIKKVPVYR